jgi:monoamine oxidase
VIGAGIAGLVCALELERAGFRVTILEARHRPGGRVWTVRHGDDVDMRGEGTQRCDFSEGLYFNAGAGRIPSIHTHLLNYCRELRVRLEVEVNSSLSARMEDSHGSVMQMREAIYDTRGRIAELLAKAVHQGTLDAALSREDRERLLPFLQVYGDLQENFEYRGSTQTGYSRAPAAGDQTAISREPRTLHDLLLAPRLRSTLYSDYIVMQGTMLQPVGGMQAIPDALSSALKRGIRYGVEIDGIFNESESARVTFRDLRTGNADSVSSDFVVCTIPLPLLRNVRSNLSPLVQRAIGGTVDTPATKVAFESPRFWERDQIYGGLSFSDPDAGLIWYPSNDLNTDGNAILVAAYVSGEDASVFSKRPLAEQIERARRAVAHLHPGHDADMRKGLVVNWDKIPYSHGIMLDWSETSRSDQPEEQIRAPEFALLNRGEGRVYFAGSQLSQLTGWQEGAVLSAHRIIGLLADRVRAEPKRHDRRIP